MKVYTKIYWINVVLYGLVVVALAFFVTALVLMVQAQKQPLTDMLDKWVNFEPGVIGSKYFQSELAFPEDQLPARPPPRQTTNEKGVNIMIRKPKGIDLDPKPLPPVKGMGEGHDPDLLARRVPQCILLGFGKCGTSALLEFLELHPNIVTLDWEPDYFCDRMYPKYDLQWYVKKMPPSYPDQITVEKSPCYIVEHDAHLRMHAMNSSLKLMVLVRDPIVRVLSEYGHYSATERYWGRIPTPLVNRITSKSTGKLNEAQLLKIGNYLPHFEHLFKVFPKNQVLILDGDLLISDPLSQTRRVEDFLSLPHLITDTHIYMDQDKGFYCMLSPESGEKKCLGKSKGRQHEILQDELKAELSGFYRPHNEKLFDLIGERFEWL